ncbi:diguanylate phosphodiesterase [Paraburkholderia aromaticivorans]|uniref:Diguanylate phosphodiesterase n=2 Tax=Paraburkholderia aromaticivorans TaxID=2026199 RepID=A0A248VS70_9BURK|nr:diguanylate phosphodiesterase [Paraburkholderia aromaticivorans]
MANPAQSSGASNHWMDDDVDLYDQKRQSVFASLLSVMTGHAAEIVDAFYLKLAVLPKSKAILEALSPDELEHLKAKQRDTLLTMASPDLSAHAHREMALRVGRVHAIIGLDREELVRSRIILATEIRRSVDPVQHNEALSLLARRLTRDLAFQTEAYQQIQASRQQVLMALTNVAWEAETYTDLIGLTVNLLGRHEEVAGCSVGRPDSQGVFRFESASGGAIRAYVAHVEAGSEQQITTDAMQPQGQGPAGRAWRSGEVHRVVDIATDPSMEPWRERAAMAGFRSSIAIPLRQPGKPAKAILSLYSAYPGGYSSEDQSAFIAMLQSLLGLAIDRIENSEGHTRTVPYTQRQRWTELLHSEALVMYYQPLLDIRTGEVTKIEVLARLRDGDRVLSPAVFFPVMSSNDFFHLYVSGLNQALAQRNAWLRDDLDLAVAINLPPAALSDLRYFTATQQALAQHGCAPHVLTLEVLETDDLPANSDVLQALNRFKALGVILAEDDLGSGHSSLNRLRQLPFDWIKIDRNITNLADQDANSVLRFIYQLTRLGHSLGKSVVVEGIEHVDLLDAIGILGADAVQGYAIAEPMPAAQLTNWLATRPRTADTSAGHPRKGAFVKLAQLLIWEERLHLVSEDPLALTRLADIGNTPSASNVGGAVWEAPLASACQVCPFSTFFSDMDSIFPAGFGDESVKRAFVHTAINEGPRSEAYLAAREAIVEAILAASA